MEYPNLIESNMLNGYKNTELFCSKSTKELVECNEKYCFKKTADTEGNSLRVFYDDRVEMYTSHGKFNDNKTLEERTKDILPFSKMSSKVIPFHNSFLLHEFNDNHSTRQYHELFRLISQKLQLKNFILKNLFFQRDFDYFELLNTEGVNGYGYRYFCSPGLEIYDVLKRENKVYYKIIDDDDFENALIKIVDNLKDEKTSNNINLYDKCKTYMLTGSVVSNILYSYLAMLSEEYIKAKQSYFSYNNYNGIKLSNLLTIVENSKENNIIGGVIDGEGIIREPIEIISKGGVLTTFHNTPEGQGAMPTASSYRFDYKNQPFIRPSKIAVQKGSLTSDELLLKYGLVGVIDDLQGLEESLNILTFDFNAIAHVRYFYYGKMVGKSTFNVNSNLQEILKGVIDIGNEREYGFDGSILTPDFIIEKKVFKK